MESFQLKFTPVLYRTPVWRVAHPSLWEELSFISWHHCSFVPAFSLLHRVFLLYSTD